MKPFPETTAPPTTPQDSAPEIPSLHPPIPPSPASLSQRAAALTRRALDKLPGGSFTRSVTVLAGGTALGQAITIAAAPLLTRLYTPDDFGVLGVYASLLAIFTVVASLRYELAIPLPDKDKNAAPVLVVALTLVPIVSILLAILLWLFHANLLHWMNAPFLAPYLWLLPIGVLLTGTYQVFSYWAVRRKAFSHIAQTKLNQGVASVLIQIALFPLGAYGLLLGRIARNTAGLTTLLTLAWKRDRKAFLDLSTQDATTAARRYRRFPKYSALAGLANSAGLQLPALLLAAYYGPFVVGQFVLVQRVAGWPLHLIGQAISQVYFGRAAETFRSSPKVFYRLFLQLTLRLALIAILPVGLLILAGPWLFSAVFGNQWSTAGHYATILAIMLFAQFIVSPLSATLSILERQSWILFWNVLRLTSVTLALSVAFWVDATDTATIAAYATTMTACYACRFLLDLLAFSRSSRALSHLQTVSHP